jgi:signal transduction histidine kinase
LGLTVSYNIVTAHGGTLDLVKGNGDGACFRIFLPLGVAP